MATKRTSKPKPYRGGLLEPIHMPATMSNGRGTVLGHAVNRGTSYPWSGTIVGDTFFVGLLEDEARHKLRELEREHGTGDDGYVLDHYEPLPEDLDA